MVMATHGAIVANVHMGPAVLPLTPDDITIAFLPSAHIAQRVVVEILPILSGHASLVRREPAQTTARNQGRAADVLPRPAARLGARLHQHPHRDPEEAGRRAEGLLRRAGPRARRRQVQARREAGSAAHPPAARLAHRVIFSKIRDRFGGRFASRPPAQPPLAPTSPNSTKPSACR